MLLWFHGTVCATEKYMYGSSGLGKGELSTDKRHQLIIFLEGSCASRSIYVHTYPGLDTPCIRRRIYAPTERALG